jgi:hypothetical protein
MVPPPGCKLALLFIAGALRKIEHTVCSNIDQVFLLDIRNYPQANARGFIDDSDAGIRATGARTFRARENPGWQW